MATPEAIRKACDALYDAMAEIDAFEDRPDLASPTTRGNFEECYKMLAELAVVKGLIKHPRHTTQGSESPAHDEDIPEEAEGSDEVGSSTKHPS
jgi:hypothetical protein